MVSTIDSRGQGHLGKGYDKPIGEVRKDAHVVLHGMVREVPSL